MVHRPPFRRCLLIAAALLLAYPGWPQGGGRGGGRPREVALPADMQPLLALSAVAGRPTDRAVAINVLSATAGSARVDYSTATGQTGQHSAPVVCSANVPVEIALTGLQPDTAYSYRVRVGEQQTPEQGFHTARAPGSAFTFEVQGDSHPERPQMFDAGLYAQTLRAAAADRPDFYLTLGDDFSVDTLQTPTAEAVDQIYRTQRLFLSLVGAPLFLVNGNHEQAALCNLDGTPDNVAVWAGNARNRYFPLPAPDGFYTADARPVEHIGLLRDYYAWTWGDALFAVIDPYWHSPQPVDNVRGGRDKGTRDLWEVTLGDEQYRWLQQTLEASSAKYKFVFAHHVLGTGRGGIEEAGWYEWGGQDRRGVSEFAQRRPGWELPIHQLMARNGVTVFFQGHDHIFARQQLDGVIYQSLPLPADPYYALYNRDAYRTGDALPGSGRVRVTVAPDKLTVDYIRSFLPKDGSADHQDGEIGYSYAVAARQ
ncbi:metallophosphoesterase [bacterium]|nr:metallophosphoesterase [bacterium]